MAENWRTSSVRREQRRLHEDSKATSCKERDSTGTGGVSKEPFRDQWRPCPLLPPGSEGRVEYFCQTRRVQTASRRSRSGTSGDPALCSHLAVKKGEYFCQTGRVQAASRRSRSGTSDDPALCSHLAVKKGVNTSARQQGKGRWMMLPPELSGVDVNLDADLSTLEADVRPFHIRKSKKVFDSRSSTKAFCF